MGQFEALVTDLRSVLASYEDKPAVSAEIDEACVDLYEQAVRADGTIPVKIIQPGWGSSGYYPSEVLERDGPNIFKAGTHMYWNHPTMREESERPEGDLRDLAGALVSDARYEQNGAAGPGLYADARVFDGFQTSVNDLAPHIGVSIRAGGTVAQGEVDGRKGSIVQSLDSARSIDFVTQPGAGGQIVAMFEAARPGRSNTSTDEERMQEHDEGINMDELQKLQEQVRVLEKRLEESETVNAEREKTLQAAEAELARQREAKILADAQAITLNVLSQSTLPEITQKRVAESLAGDAPTSETGELDAEALTATVQEAIKTETEYLEAVVQHNTPRVTGFGQPNDDEGSTGRDFLAEMTGAFSALGLSESEAEQASKGRLQ